MQLFCFPGGRATRSVSILAQIGLKPRGLCVKGEAGHLSAARHPPGFPTQRASMPSTMPGAVPTHRLATYHGALFDNIPEPQLPPAPAMAADTGDICCELLGMSDKKIEELVAAGALQIGNTEKKQ